MTGNRLVGGKAVHSPLEAPQLGDTVLRVVVRRSLAYFAFTEQVYLFNQPRCEEIESMRQSDRTRTHPPALTFSIAELTAGCQIPLPLNVSMTCPFRKNAENTLKSPHEVSTLFAA